MTTGFAAWKLVINVSAWSFLWSWVCKDYVFMLETKGNRHACRGLSRVCCALRDFTSGVLNLHVLPADSFRYGRRRGLDENANACWPFRRKYSRTHRGERDGTIGGMLILYEQSFSLACNARMCVERNNTIFDGIKADVSTDHRLCAEAKGMLLPWIMLAVSCVIAWGGGLPFWIISRLDFA